MIFSIWITAIFIQVGITSFLALQFIRYKTEEPTSPISFSIIIAAHNELKNLKKLIPKVLEQTHRDFEIAIVLDRCTDQSLTYLEGLNESKIKILEIEKTEESWDHKKYALTKGVKSASGEWLVFTDADCYPNTNEWLSEINSKIKSGTKIILGYSPYETSNSLLHNFIQYEGFVTAFNYLSNSILGQPYMGVGRNLSIEKSFFNKKKGYESFKSVIGGDDDLFIQNNSNSNNTKILMGKNSIVYTIPKINWRDYFNQKTRHLSIGSRYSILDQAKHLLFHGSLIAIWAILPLISIEIILPILLFYLLVKAIGYRFAQSKMGAGFNYILLPLVDVMYAIFLPIIAIRSKLIKDIRWKN